MDRQRRWQRRHKQIVALQALLQDAAATIKRQTQLLLPYASIFLDVDDLKSIDELEEYIEESSTILMFMTLGYFTSKNCLREVHATLDQEKPYVLVRETDPDRGGPLETLKLELEVIIYEEVMASISHAATKARAGSVIW